MLTGDDRIHERAVFRARTYGANAGASARDHAPCRRDFRDENANGFAFGGGGANAVRKTHERNRRRSENIVYLSENLEKLGFRTFLPPEHVSRVYFEFLIRPKDETSEIPANILIEALEAEGCIVSAPRYPLLHQQPFFTENFWTSVARLPDSVKPPVYKADALPRTEAENRKLIKLPVFPTAQKDLLDQYALAFEKVLNHAGEIAEKIKE